VHIAKIDLNGDAHKFRSITPQVNPNNPNQREIVPSIGIEVLNNNVYVSGNFTHSLCFASCMSTNFRSGFLASFCETPFAPVPEGAWPNYLKVGTDNVTLAVKQEPGLQYTWSVDPAFEIKSGAGTNRVTISAKASINQGSIFVLANNTCGAGNSGYVYNITNGAKDPATISIDNIVKTYGDPAFKLNATSNSAAAIEYSIVTNENNAISLDDGAISIVNAGTVKLAARVAGDATYGDGLKEFAITINKKPLLVKAKNTSREKGKENPPLEIQYGNTPLYGGNGLQFDGVNDFAYIEPNDRINSITNELTVEAWVKISSLTGYNLIAYKIDGTPQQGINFSVYFAGLRAIVGDATGQTSSISSSRVIKPGEWTHVACTYKANGKLRIYINGEPMGEVTANGGLTGVPGLLSMGGFGNNNDDPNALDELRIWNIERSAAEIKSSFADVVNVSSTGLIAYYNFDQGVAGGNNSAVIKLSDAKGNDARLFNFEMAGEASNFIKGFLKSDVNSFELNDDHAVLNTKPNVTTTATVDSPPGEYPITVAGGSDNNYSFVFEGGTLTVNKNAATITLANLNAVFSGKGVEPAATTDPAGLAVNFTYNGSIEKPVNAGTYNVTATINDANYTGSKTETLTITKATQQVTFDAIADKTIGDADFTLAATSTSGLPVAFQATPAGKVKIAGNTVSVIAAGKVTIKASQPASENYLAADEVGRTICIRPVKTTLQNIGVEKPILKSASGTGNKWYIDGELVPGASAQTFEVKQGGDVQVKVVVDGCESEPSEAIVIQGQTLTFETLPEITEGNADVAIPVTTTSSLPFTLSVKPSAKATINGNKLTAVDAGKVTLTVNQAGNATHIPAVEISIEICIKPVKPTVEVLNSAEGHPQLKSSSASGNQWLLNNEAIAGAKSQTYEITQAGIYRVRVTSDGCENVSDAIDMVITGVEGETSLGLLYPNPAEEVVIISVPHYSRQSSISIIDVRGQAVAGVKEAAEKNEVDVRHLPSGVYLVLVNNGQRIWMQKMLKK
jgi:hypothetical protein